MTNPGPVDTAVEPSLKPSTPHSQRGWLAGLSRNVYVLGLVSLFTDISSEMLVPIRFIFLISVLHTPLIIAGLIEGVAESTASLLKIVSGRLADRLPVRKPLIVAGYSISNLTKPLLALVNSWPAALGLIFLDRAGKGVRGSPRDALLADSTEPQFRGKAFGFHRSMDTFGAAIGPLLTLLILALSANNLSTVFAWTLLPGIVSVLILVFLLKEKVPKSRKVIAPDLTPSVPTTALYAPAIESTGAATVRKLAPLGGQFWLFTALSTLFAVGNSSDAFIFLRTEGLEHALEAVPLIYFGYNMVYALLATPLGALSDRWGRLPVLVAGYLAFALVYAGWARADQPWQAWILFLIYGIYAAATDGVSKAFIADIVPKSQRGRAMGWFNGLTGFVALPANIMAGWLWFNFGPGATFTLGAELGLVAAVLAVIWWPWLKAEVPFDRKLKPALNGFSRAALLTLGRAWFVGVALAAVNIVLALIYPAYWEWQPAPVPMIIVSLVGLGLYLVGHLPGKWRWLYLIGTVLLWTVFVIALFTHPGPLGQAQQAIVLPRLLLLGLAVLFWVGLGMVSWPDFLRLGISGGLVFGGLLGVIVWRTGPATSTDFMPGWTAINSQGELIVSDSDSPVIRYFGANGDLLGEQRPDLAVVGESNLSQAGPNSSSDLVNLTNPKPVHNPFRTCGLASDGHKFSYVMDTGNNTLLQFEDSNKVLRHRWPVVGAKYLSVNRGCIAATDTHIYLGVGMGPSTGQIAIFQIAGEKLNPVAQWPIKSLPGGLSLDEQGNLYVLALPLEVCRFPAGALSSSTSPQASCWNLPDTKGTAIEPYRAIAATTRRIFVGDVSSSSVAVFSSEGQSLARIGGCGSDLGQLCEPRGISTDKSGNLIVSDSGNRVIERFDPGLQKVNGLWRTIDDAGRSENDRK